MFVKKEARLEGDHREEERVDVMLKKLRANRGEPVIEDTACRVEYQPKGYLRTLKKNMERDV